jgi:hypothetical protein
VLPILVPRRVVELDFSNDAGVKAVVGTMLGVHGPERPGEQRGHQQPGKRGRVEKLRSGGLEPLAGRQSHGRVFDEQPRAAPAAA